MYGIRNNHQAFNRFATNIFKRFTFPKRTLVGKPHFNFTEFKARQEEIQKNILNRKVGADVCIDRVLEAYADFGKIQTEVNELRKVRNSLSKKISSCKVAEDRSVLIEKSRENKEALVNLESRLTEVEKKALNLANSIPNYTHPDSPIGSEDKANLLEVINEHSYPPNLKDHLELSLSHGMVDFNSAAKVSGSRFYYLHNEGALLEMALVQLAMAQALKHGFAPVLTPDIVRCDVVAACGFQPRDLSHNQNFNVTSSGHTDLCLAATSEIPLAALNMDQIIPRKLLPIKKAGLSHCFRAEAGSYGADARGLYRVHQFTKVELFTFVAPEDSERVLAELLEFQKAFFGSLGLHFRILDMPTEELGASAYRKYDIEAWLPGQKRWGEISSTSNCTDYQTRRLNIRLPRNKDGQVEFLHTLNGTACAVPRTIVAILEQYQDGTGRVLIPDILRPYFDNRKYFSLDLPKLNE